MEFVIRLVIAHTMSKASLGSWACDVKYDLEEYVPVGGKDPQFEALLLEADRVGDAMEMHDALQKMW